MNTSRFATIQRQAALLGLLGMTPNLSSFAPKFELNIPASATERIVKQQFASQMMKLPKSQRGAFIASVPEQYRTYLLLKADGLFREPKSAAKPYSNRYGRKGRAALLKHMLALPLSQRNAFVSAAPEQYRAYLMFKSIESNIIHRKAAPVKGSVTAKPVAPTPVAAPKRNEQRESFAVTKPIVPTSHKGMLNADTYINPVMRDGCLVPAGGEKALAAIARREADKMEKYSQAWKQQAKALAQSAAVPAGQRERSIKLSNTVGRRNAP